MMERRGFLAAAVALGAGCSAGGPWFGTAAANVPARGARATGAVAVRVAAGGRTVDLGQPLRRPDDRGTLALVLLDQARSSNAKR